MNTMLIVGNGPSADTPTVAKAMRKFDAVMRINNWVSGVYVGDRCDIWGTSFNTDIEPREAQAVWWSGWPWIPGGKSLYELAHIHKGREMPREARLEYLFDECKPHNPSTGLVLVDMALLRGWGVTVAGFDHFEAPLHHYWDDAKNTNTREAVKWHSPNAERRLFDLWVETRGLRRLKPLDSQKVTAQKK